MFARTLFEGIGSGAVTAPFSAALDAEVIIVIGANPTQNHPVAATFIKNAAKRGATAGWSGATFAKQRFGWLECATWL